MLLVRLLAVLTIFSLSYFPDFVLGGNDARRKAVGGCTEYVIALMACLKEAGHRPNFVRWNDHSVVRVRLPNEDGKLRDYHIDASRSRNRVVELRKRLKENIDHDVRVGKYAYGPTPASIGVLSLKDFNRYVKT